MFAKVLRLRAMGALLGGPRPPESDWTGGIFETSDLSFGAVHRCLRRLVLRHANSAPDMGLIFELYRPLLVQVLDPCLRFRGIEAVPTANGEIGGMVQEWLVLLR
jgi:hypothetical protein